MEIFNRYQTGKNMQLPDGVSLRVYKGSSVVFESCGKWLYPLFELENFLTSGKNSPTDLVLHDRIAGRAAASLICRMGFTKCKINTISRPALEVFIKNETEIIYDEIVDHILCRTEHLITDKMSSDEIYRMLKKRAGLVSGIDMEIINLSVVYDGKTVLNGLNLSLEAGERLVITGDNGAGKTTLLKALIGAVHVSDGEIRFGSKNNGNTNKGSKPSIGYVGQSFSGVSFPVSAAEIVAVGLAGMAVFGEKMKYRVEIAMRRTGCFHLRDRNFFSLSGGEKQRVSLARCLCQEAGLILLDEPTSFLDSDSKNELLEVLNIISVSHLPTILSVSHDKEWVEKLNWPVRNLEGGKL